MPRDISMGGQGFTDFGGQLEESITLKRAAEVQSARVINTGQCEDDVGDPRRVRVSVADLGQGKGALARVDRWTL